jgi:hypothetical protein
VLCRRRLSLLARHAHVTVERAARDRRPGAAAVGPGAVLTRPPRHPVKLEGADLLRRPHCVDPAGNAAAQVGPAPGDVHGRRHAPRRRVRGAGGGCRGWARCDSASSNRCSARS